MHGATCLVIIVGNAAGSLTLYVQSVRHIIMCAYIILADFATS